MSNLVLAFGNGGGPGNYYLTSTKTWFAPIDLSRLPGPKPPVDTTVEALTVRVRKSDFVDGFSDDLLYFNRILANTADGVDTLDVVRFWDDVKNVQAVSGEAEKLFFDGFVHVDVMVGGASEIGSVVTLNGSKRGNLITGAGDDLIKIAMVANAAQPTFVDDFRISTGAGDDRVILGGLDIAAELAAGDSTFLRASDNNTPLVVSGEGRRTYIDLGAGDDRLIGFDSEDHVLGGDDDGSVELQTTALAPSGFGYAVAGGAGKGAPTTLYKIDLATGATCAVAEVTVSGLKGKVGALDIEALALSPADGFLYGIAKGSGNFGGLIRVDPNSGAATFVGNTAKLWNNLQDMAFDLAGNLYLASNGDLLRVNTGTGAVTTIGNDTLSKKVGALAIDPLSGQVYALAREGAHHLLSLIDKASGAVLSTVKIGGLLPSAQIEGMSFDSAGQLWAVDRVTGAIFKLDLDTSRAQVASWSLPVSALHGDGIEALAIRVDADHILTGIDLAGGDVLTGGGGADHFLYRAGDGVDTITDFVLGTDQLHITGYAADRISIATFGDDTFIRFLDESPDGFVDDAVIKLQGVTGFDVGDLLFTDTGLFLT